jgi:hypothetical protein
MDEAADLIAVIERWQVVDEGVEVPARSVEEAVVILPYSTLPADEPYGDVADRGTAA